MNYFEIIHIQGKYILFRHIELTFVLYIQILKLFRLFFFCVFRYCRILFYDILFVCIES